MSKPNKELHIVFIASWYPSEKNPLLGIFIRRHAEALAMFHRVTVLHAVADDDMKKGEFRIQKQEEGKLREVIVYFGRNSTKKGIFRMAAQNKLLTKHYRFGAEKISQWYGEVDLLHLNVIWPLGRIARKLSKFWKAPLVITEHWTGYHPEDGRYRGMAMKWLSGGTTKKAKKILPVSEHLMAAMKGHGLKGNYEVVPNVVNTQVFHPKNEKPEIKQLIHVSALDDHQKNISGLLRAFQKVRKKHPSLELLIVGGGPDEAALKRLSNELGLTFRGVNFTGKLIGIELAKAYQNSSALILNSRFENQPVVMLEALCCGIPVIAPKIGGIPEVISEDNGVLFDANKEESLLQAVDTWMSRSDSYDRQTIGKSAAERFGKEQVGKKLSDIYSHILGEC